MRLKSIKAYGFKSFADKIEIEVKDGITGIVGPNGSGKSNIVDAIKWVLGEQSVKALRGSKEMSDVIFQGSQNRKPLTRASVSLVFDNQDHSLNSEYDEIEIKRTVYNSGENEYMINNSKVRLKDITDMFMDSGAGKEAFSIISQGRIGEILNGKPEDRRSIIEEAAGVLKYKKRKIDSLKKLEKTNDNLSKIELIINELEVNLEPLREQSEKAKLYENYKKDLETNEIGLLIKDITDINSEYEALRIDRENLQKEIENISASNTKDDTKIEMLKLTSIKYDEEISKLSKSILNLTEEISSLEAKKQIIIERKKYEVDDVKLENNIIALKESIRELSLSLSNIENENNILKDNIKDILSNKDDLLNELRKLNVTKNSLNNEISSCNRDLGIFKNKIDILESNINEDTLMPYSVKSILNNPRLKGIHGTLSNLIEVKSDYITAIDTVLGMNQNILITDDEIKAKEAINYLKENKLGRATFYPLNIIKPKTIDERTYKSIKDETGFIGILSSLVACNPIYKNIVLNLLGNVIVVKDIDSLNNIGKKINYTYRVVSLDGEILHTGGSLTGGVKKQSKSTLTEKNNIIEFKNKVSTINKELEYKLDKLGDINTEIELIQNNLSNKEIYLQELVEKQKNKDITITNLKEQILNKTNELNGTENIRSSKLDNELEEAMDKFYKKQEEKNILESNLDNLKSKKSDLQNEINEIDLLNRKFNSEYNKKLNTLKEYEISMGKMDIKLDNMLLRLNEEYSITYERAKEVYEIPIDIESTRSKVNELKRNIKALGEVNTGSISEYERIKTRYDFLTEQKNDLNNSIEELLKIINEMDTQMIEEFSNTFEKVNTEFKKVFSKLFKGGHGELSLTDPDNILETGVDIKAEPPGKKLKNITLLSGGEKTLTAISLLFAILNVKVVPFCVLDEVEAALDEANVDTFGTYLKEYEHKTQFIIITHKKKTMEYANTLYGITMQESGVSKLVSVKLENLK